MRSTFIDSPKLILTVFVTLLVIIFQSTQEFPGIYFDEFRIVMVSDWEWTISFANINRIISFRTIFSYLRWVALVSIILFAAYDSFTKHKTLRSVNKADISILMFIIVATISCLYSINVTKSIMRVISLVLMYLAVFWGIWLYADRYGDKSVIHTIVIVVTIVFVLHILNIFFDRLGSFPYFGRFQGWTINPGIAASHASLFFPIVLYVSLQSSKWQYWLLIAAMIFVLIMSQTRTEIVAMSIGSLYFVFRSYPKHRFISVLSVTLILVISYAWIEIGPRIYPKNVDFDIRHLFGSEIVVQDNSLDKYLSLDDDIDNWYDRFNPRTADARTLAHRTDKWRLGLTYFVERPFHGFGFGTEDQLFEYHGVEPQNYQLSGAYMHNSYLGLLLQVGLLGAFLFYAPIGFLVWSVIFRHYEWPDNYLRDALISVVLTCLIAGLFSSDLYSMGNIKSIIFWISIMMLIRSRRVQTQIQDIQLGTILDKFK